MQKTLAIVGGVLAACFAAASQAAWTHYRWDGVTSNGTGRLDMYFDFSTFNSVTKTIGKAYVEIRINTGTGVGLYTSGGIASTTFELATSDGSYFNFRGRFANGLWWFLDHRPEVVFNTYSVQAFMAAASLPYPQVRMSATPNLFFGPELSSIGSAIIDSAPPIIPASGSTGVLLAAAILGSRRRRTMSA